MVAMSARGMDMGLDGRYKCDVPFEGESLSRSSRWAAEGINDWTYSCSLMIERALE
jgi:hypothetical protein